MEESLKEKAIYLQAYSEGEHESMMKLYHWLTDENREPPQTYFGDRTTRMVANEILFMIKSTNVCTCVNDSGFFTGENGKNYCVACEKVV